MAIKSSLPRHAPVRKRAISHFIGALTKPSVLSVTTMLITAMTCLAAVLILLPPFMRSDASSMMATPTDHHLFVTAEILKLKEPSQSEKPMMIIAGASVIQSSFGTTKKVSSSLKNTFGISFDVHLLTTSRQNLVEHFLILDHLPDDRPVLVVLGIGPSRFTWGEKGYLNSYKEQRFGTSSDTYLEQLTIFDPELDQPFGHEFVDYPGFYVNRMGRLLANNFNSLRKRPPPSRDENQHLGKFMGKKEYKEHANMVLSRFNKSRETVEKNHQLFRKLLQFVADRPNVRLVVMEHPMNPDFVTNYFGDEAYKKHISDMKRITSEEGVAYFNPGRTNKLQGHDFYDWAHISSSSAQDKLRAAMVQQFEKIGISDYQ